MWSKKSLQRNVGKGSLSVVGKQLLTLGEDVGSLTGKRGETEINNLEFAE